ncbi:putative helicase [Podospora fimiseda]|uniref:Helicase n=1 Tax=Podospora fimiseda TaxID=252190 RepID=A0AAN7BUF5_9PEZI|nr:putative helicase [Podospora fimiseda]
MSMETNELESTIIEWHQEWEEFPPDAHLCCPKVHDEDDNDYSQFDDPYGDDITTTEKRLRVEQYKHRLSVTYDLSLLMGIPQDRASTWLHEWKDKVESFLQRCDDCIRNWHRGREQFVKRLNTLLAQDQIAYMKNCLFDFDKQRIYAGLLKAREILEQRGPMSTGKLVRYDEPAVLALFEALCSMQYLQQRDGLDNFNYVFEKTQLKNPLKLGGSLLPSMTWFLFEEPQTPYKYRFAKVSWEKRDPDHPMQVLSQDEWDWAVAPYLTEFVLRASYSRGGANADRICRFWSGFRLILRIMTESTIINCLRAMEVSPSVYFLALEHLTTDSEEALAEVLKGLQGLMEKSSKAFWAAFDQLTPSALVEEVFKSPAFRRLLAKSLTPEMMVSEGDAKTPLLAVWLKAFIRSLPSIQRSDACDCVLQHLLTNFRQDPSFDRAAQATCTLAGLITLGESLNGYLNQSEAFDTGTGLIMVNQLLNKVVQYQDIIVKAAGLKPEDTYNVGISQAAISITHSALALDARATEIEWQALMFGKPVQEAVTRDSGKLWECFLEMLWHKQTGHVDLAQAMLKSTLRLRSIEQFIPPRKEKLKPQQEKFNRRYQQQTAAIGRMLGRISEFTHDELDSFFSEVGGTAIHSIVSSLVHGEEPIREAGFELIKAFADEITQGDAVARLVEVYFIPFLEAITDSVNRLTAVKGLASPWTHMIPVLKCSEFVLNALCDPSVGQLRRKTLTYQEHVAVQHWWDSVWQAVDHSFRMMRRWHEKVDKRVMEDFCRDIMELANKLFDQDGVLVSAFSTNYNNSKSVVQASDAMKDVLEPPRKSSHSLVDMLQLRDKYLIQGIIKVIKRLVDRLKQKNMELPEKTLAHLANMIKNAKRLPGGKLEYTQKTNLTDEQRIELLKALGEDEVIEELFMGIKPGDKEAKEKERVLKQSRLDFSKATVGSSRSRSLKDDMSDLTPNFEKRKSVLASLREEIVKPKAPVKLSPMAIAANQSSIKEARAREKAEKAKRDAEAIAKAKALRMPTKIVAGEGSGLQGIAGVRGKEHAPVIKDEMMVGSSSEDEDDDDDDDEVIALKAKAANKGLSEAERIRLLELAQKSRGPVKKTKIMRSAKDMRARLIPPMDTLHQAILEWDIFHEGNNPPNGYRCAGVSSTYNDPVSYKQTFFPLLINEAWRSFVTAKDETTSKPFGIKVLSRMSVDKFMEVTAAVPATISKDQGLSEGDIVIISKAQDPLTGPGEPHCLSRIWKTTWKKDVVEVVYRLSGRGSPILPVLLPGAEFQVVKITNMTTIEREYAALESLQYYDLMDEVLKAQPSPMLNFGDEAIKGVMQNYNLNLGQAKAILNAKENDGFTLVQGPPGTGKTKTIVAMVGCLLTNALKSSGGVSLNRLGPAAHNTAPAKKLLVCAPSNAAVDELVLRLKNGVKTFNGAFHKIEVVRLGRSDAINAGVRDVTLDERVKARMDAELNNNGPSDREKLHKEAAEIKTKLDELRPQLEAARASEDRQMMNKFQREFDELMRRRAHIGSKIEADKSNGNTFARETEIKRRQIQQEILDKAQVLCATLSGSGHEMFKNLNVEFETVIIDEAAQCVELSALIPLKYGCSKCILVGDPKQLPPTVLSQSAARYGYDQSLFVRMQKNHAKDVHLLDMQYRMHPEISRFPSKEFYEGLLQDGADMAGLRTQPWHQSVYLGPYRFFDVVGSQERGPKNQSLVNEAELKVAMQLYNRFRTDYGNVDAKGKIGIITPYKAQLQRLRSRFTEKYGEGITEEIEFNTTDAFQGRECEIIIFSCVRASPTGGIGFMTDIRRMNVGLTRAKSSLWILGDSRALVQGEFWAKLIEDARERDRYTSGDILRLLSVPGPKQHPSAFASLPAPPSRVNQDVEMTDAPVASIPYRGPGIGGINERGEAIVVKDTDSIPEIQVTAPGAVKKKRARENNEDGRSAKKANQKLDTAAPTGIIPMAAKVKPPIDPSGMEVLGLVPPERPPPPQQSRPGPSQGPRPNASRGPGGPPPARKAADPFIRRKRR